MAIKRLFVDMDGTLARFHDQVNYLERMFEKDFFCDLEPFDNMVEGIRQFIKLHPDVEVFILSAAVDGEPPYCREEKHAWLDNYLPEIPKENRIFTKMGHRKAEFIPGGLTKDDYLLDDYNKGLYQFMYDGGSAIKCHNNINQKGLGAHGGQRGHLWVGPMVHTTDKPEMIAAEISQHMGLEYDLKRVVGAYPEVTEEFPELDFAHINSARYNPLNVIRRYTGNDDFYEVTLNEQDKFCIPQFLLTSICTNVYGVPDFNRMFIEPEKLYQDVKLALEQAKLPVVGQVNYVIEDTGVKNKAFYSFDDMQAEIEKCKKSGRAIDIRWNIEPDKARLKNVVQADLPLAKQPLDDRINAANKSKLSGAQAKSMDNPEFNR